MDKVISCVPFYSEDLGNQTKASDISNEDFHRAIESHVYTWYHRRLFHISLERGKKFCFNIACFGFRCIFLGFGHIWIRKRGKIDPETRVIISNHTAFVDPFVVACCGHITCVMKKELSKTALFRIIFEIVDPIYVDRSKQSGQSQLIKERIEDTGKSPILIFPEGTLNDGSMILQLHKGAFLTNAKVQPMLIRYWMPLVPKNWNSVAWTDTNFLEYVWCCVSIPFFSIITVDILPPVTLEKEGEGDIEKYAEKVQLIIANHLHTRAVTRSSNEIFQHRKAVAEGKVKSE